MLFVLRFLDRHYLRGSRCGCWCWLWLWRLLLFSGDSSSALMSITTLRRGSTGARSTTTLPHSHQNVPLKPTQGARLKWYERRRSWTTLQSSAADMVGYLKSNVSESLASQSARYSDPLRVADACYSYSPSSSHPNNASTDQYAEVSPERLRFTNCAFHVGVTTTY